MGLSDKHRLDAAQLADLCLRRAVGSQHLASGLIDYFASNEPLLLSLCANNQLKPEDFMRVWHRLNPAG
jgi:hypothetical protein